MKRMLLLGFMLCVMAAAQAQRVYFIYLQSEKSKPFYVKLSDKVYSSSAEGYLIIPKLVDSTYTFVVGNAGKQSSEAKFSVSINKNDRGFLIREADNTLSLFDLQSMDVLKSVTYQDEASAPIAKRTDGFTRLLSEAADDSTLLNIVVLKKEKPRLAEAATPAVVKTDTVIAAAPTVDTTATITETNAQALVIRETPPVAPTVSASNDTVTNHPINDTAVSQQTEVVQKEQPAPVDKPEDQVQETYQRSVVTRRSESSTSEGFGLVFLDKQNGATDTIRLLIPNQKIVLTDGTAQQPAASKPAAENNLTTDTEGSAIVLSEKQKPACASLATENDFLKLRKNMAAKPSEYTMVTEAARTFRSKCFTTEQVRNLSSLFLTAEGKFSFFDAAYTHVSDPEQFASLQAEIKDYHYSNRFKALISK